MRVLGVDPGATGALALVEVEAVRLVAVLDMPVIRHGAAALVDGALVLDSARRPGLGFGNRRGRGRGPGQGVATMFQMGRLAGGIDSLLVATGKPLVHVSSGVWKSGPVLAAIRGRPWGWPGCA